MYQGWLRLDIKGNFFTERVVTGQWWRSLKAPWMWHLRTGSGGLSSAGETTGLKDIRGLFQPKESCNSLPTETLKMEDAPC